jgi:hypothetical protein
LLPASGNNPLPGFPVVNSALLTIVIEQLPATNAKPRLAGAVRIVDSGMDNLAVTGGQPFPETPTVFQNQYLVSLQSQLAANGKADNTGPDHDRICLEYFPLCHQSSNSPCLSVGVCRNRITMKALKRYTCPRKQVHGAESDV